LPGTGGGAARADPVRRPPFRALLHHFELSNWILYARAYGARDATPDAIVMRLDMILRAAPTALGWLAEHWIDADAAETPA
jgi:hypothetical protein